MIFGNYNTASEEKKKIIMKEFYADKELNIGTKGIKVSSILNGMIVKEKRSPKNEKLEGMNKTLTEMSKKGWDYFDWRE